MGGIKVLQLVSGALVDFLWPPICHTCGERAGVASRWLCDKCLASLPRFGYADWDLNPMAERFAGKVPFVAASAFLEYNSRGMLAPLFHDFKYRGFPSLARYMGTLAGEAMQAFFADTDALLPVPMFPLKQLRRGYNQAKEIALGISQITGTPIGRGLRAVHGHRSQTGMTATERIANTRDVFRYHTDFPFGSNRHSKNLPRSIEPTICLVDDVCTTGSTLLSCARAVLAAAPTARLRIFALGVVLNY